MQKAPEPAKEQKPAPASQQTSPPQQQATQQSALPQQAQAAKPAATAPTVAKTEAKRITVLDFRQLEEQVKKLKWKLYELVNVYDQLLIKAQNITELSEAAAEQPKIQAQINFANTVKIDILKRFQEIQKNVAEVDAAMKPFVSP